MIDYRRRLILPLSAGVALLTVALPAHGGGAFTAMYFGESVFAQSSRSQGMGGAGLGFTEGIPDALNPVSLIRSPLACFSLVYRPQFSWADDGYASQRIVSGQLSSGIFSLPLGKGLFIGLGAEQLHSVSYRSFLSDTTDAGVSFEKRLSKSGGIYGGGFSLAYRPIPAAALGIGYRWLFGGIAEQTEIDFESAVYTDTDDELVEKHDGRYVSIGAMVAGPKIGVGMYYRPRIEGSGKFHLTTTHRIEKTDSYEFSLAERFGIGVNTGPWSGLSVAVDIWHERWSAASYGSEDAEFFDCTPVSIGLEYVPAKREGKPYPPLRLGYRWHPGYYAVRLRDGTSSTNPPSDYAVSIGTSFSAGKGRGALDLALLYGHRGGTLLHDVSERYVELSLGFAGSEKWTTRRFRGN